MSFEVFKAYIDGYSDGIFDQTILAVQSGYWAAYFANAKHPKPVKNIITDMLNRKDARKQRARGNVKRPEVDVEAFVAMEDQFLKRLQSK